jgi:FAD/FMN-containing dehydrogenase
MELKSFAGITASVESLEIPYWSDQAIDLLTNQDFFPVGMGRSYGDVGLSSNSRIISNVRLNRFKSFDETSGILDCEPGVLLRDIQAIFVKRGWMLPVTPGTSWVSVAGAIANDVHGKDHHFAGTFGHHVLDFTLARSDGSILFCSPTENSEMYRATIGGLGLTGFILSARLQLKKVAGPYFDTEVIPYGSVGEFFEISEQTEVEGWQATVSWFDCSTSNAGRGSFTRGNPSDRKYDATSDDDKLDLNKPSLNFPVTPPISLVNKISLDVFNTLYFQLQKSLSGRKELHYKDFYYPLDGISNWNRIYGPRGFFQYQSVIPMDSAKAATEEMLAVIKKSSQGSFLGVIKTFADQPSAGMLSFARHGVTLALDFPNRGEKTELLFEKLDSIVFHAGGTLNPSKDARMSAKMFELGYPELQEFMKFRDPEIRSDFSERVFGELS